MVPQSLLAAELRQGDTLHLLYQAEVELTAQPVSKEILLMKSSWSLFAPVLNIAKMWEAG